MSFQKATRRQRRLRMAITGPKGAGKTVLALRLAGALGRRIAVIDGDRGAVELYVGEEGIPEFELRVMRSFHPRAYVNAIRDAERAGYDVIVVDNLSSAWAGPGGALELADKAPNGWKEVGQLQNALVETIHGCTAHLIFTLRSRMEYVAEQLEGGAVSRRVGLAPEQRAGLEYEVDVLAELDAEHALRITGRCMELDGLRFAEPDPEALGHQLLTWANAGAPLPPPFKDRYGLLLPRSATPRFAKGHQFAGRAWLDVPVKAIAQLYEQYGRRMSADQRDWAEYLITRDQARRAEEALLTEAKRAALDAENVNSDAEPLTDGSDDHG